MIARNSLKSVLRSPVKTILFFILLLSLTTALTLGSALVGMCSMLIDECKRTYVTEASIEYRAGRFPYKAVTDENAFEIRKSVPFDEIEKLSFVEKIDMSRSVTVSVPDFPMIINETPAENVFIGVVRRMGTAYKAYKVIYADVIGDNSVIRVHNEDADAGEFMLVTGFTDGNIAGVIDVTVGDIINNFGKEQGFVQEFNCIDVSDDPMLENGDSRYDFFFSAAENYKKINTSTYAVVSEDPAYLEPFVEKEYVFKDGGLWTAENIKTNGSCCILPNFIADRMGIAAGDRLTLEITSTEFTSIIDSYWSDHDNATSIDFYVTGVFSTTSNERPLIYISDCGTKIPVERINGFSGYTLGTIKLKNGVTEKQLKTLKGLMPEKADVSVRDQGYSVIVEMLEKLELDALAVTGAAFAATAAMLVLFGYVFVGRQSDALVTMYMMGTPKKSLRAYVAIAAGTVLVPAAAAGCAAASLFSDKLVDFISKTLEQGQSLLKLYSTASLGTVTIIDVTVSMPWWPGVLCGIGVALLGLLSCLAFLKNAVGKIGAKVKIKTKKEKRPRFPASAKPLNIKGAGLKYLILSITRGGLRSVAVPVIGAVMTLFILVPAGAITMYENRLKELEDNTVIKGYLTDYGGKKSYDLVFTDSMLNRFADGEYFSDIHLSLNDPYSVYSVERRRTGETEQYSGEPVTGGFRGENFLTNFMNGPKMFYTDAIGYTPEFFAADDPEISYLEGYDDSWFESDETPFEGLRLSSRSTETRYFDYTEDKRELCAVVSESFLEKYGLELGDRITVDISSDLVRETYLIIGSFRSVGSGDTIYTRIANSAKLVPAAMDKMGNPINKVKVRTSYSSCAFRLTNTSDIRAAKEWLRDKGFSRVHSSGFYRLYPVLADRDYCESVEKIEKNIGYLKNMVPALSVLVAVAGIAAASLMAYRRRVEIATLRSIGQKDFSVFLLFLAEQVLPAAIGAAVSFAVFLIFAGLNGYSILAVSFIAGFLAGSLVSLLRMSKTNLLDVLSDKEDIMILELKDVTFSYRSKWNKVDVLKGVNCGFERGKVYGIIGKSGSGKSTVLSLMAGITLPQGGDVLHEGVSTSSMNLQEYRRDKVSVIYQSFRLLPLLTSIENVMYPMELRKVPKKEAKARAEKYLKEVEIPENCWYRFPVTLSGGEQQRVAIARALASETHLILADEPTGNLDAENSDKIIELLKTLAKEHDYCVIIVTHDVDVMDKLDVIYRMQNGILVERK